MRVGIGANVAVIGACVAAVIFAGLSLDRPEKDVGDKPPPPPPPPESYRVLLPSDVKSLWEASWRCTTEGARWREAATLNPNVPVYGERAIIQDTGQELNIPGDWNCPVEWRIELATETNENGPPL